MFAGGLLRILSNAAKDLHQCIVYFSDSSATLKHIEKLVCDTERMWKLKAKCVGIDLKAQALFIADFGSKRIKPMYE